MWQSVLSLLLVQTECNEGACNQFCYSDCMCCMTLTSCRKDAQASKEQMMTTKKCKKVFELLFRARFSLKTVEVRIDRGGTCWGIRPPALTALAKILTIFWAIGCNFGGKNVTFGTQILANM